LFSKSVIVEFSLINAFHASLELVTVLAIIVLRFKSLKFIGAIGVVGELCCIPSPTPKPTPNPITIIPKALA